MVLTLGFAVHFKGTTSEGRSSEQSVATRSTPYYQLIKGGLSLKREQVKRLWTEARGQEKRVIIALIWRKWLLETGLYNKVTF